MAAMAFSDGYKGWQICKQARGAGHHFVAQELSSRYCRFMKKLMSSWGSVCLGSEVKHSKYCETEQNWTLLAGVATRAFRA